MIYQIQQQLNQFQNQINSLSMSMNMNQLNLNNQISLNNNIQNNNMQSQNNNNITVIFRLSGPWEDQAPKAILIQCNPKESIQDLIQK